VPGGLGKGEGKSARNGFPVGGGWGIVVTFGGKETGTLEWARKSGRFKKENKMQDRNTGRC